MYMHTPNIYDRLPAMLEARRQAELAAAEQERLAAIAAAELAAAPPVLQLQPQQNGWCIAGLNLQIPQGFDFHESATTLAFQGHFVQLVARRRALPEGADLEHAADGAFQALREQHSQLTLVRRAPTLLAGHPAISLDYHFSVGTERRHGRSVCAFVATAAGGPPQWLQVTTVIDPEVAKLATWLTQFDAMLATVSAQ